MITIGVIGNGFVGSATSELECDDISVLCYDTNPALCKPRDIEFRDLSKCSLVFVSVPTPMKENGDCHIDIVTNVVGRLKHFINPKKTGIVIRSTVPVGTCDALNCFFMPEFLTEKNFINDFKTCEKWIFGMNEKNGFQFREKITELFQTAKKNGCIEADELIFLSNKEAETIKYVRNTFLAMKVGFANEWYSFCQKHNIDYEQVRKHGFGDKRIGLSHSDCTRT